MDEKMVEKLETQTAVRRVGMKDSLMVAQKAEQSELQKADEMVLKKAAHWV